LKDEPGAQPVPAEAVDLRGGEPAAAARRRIMSAVPCAAIARAPGWPGRSGAPIPDRDTGSNPSDRPSGRDASL
jgi:hypothetical protein